jgi:hypothetical protein
VEVAFDPQRMPMDNTKNAGEKLAYTVPEFTKVFGISRTSIYKRIKTGELETVKRFGRRLIPRESALRLLEPVAQLKFTKSHLPSDAGSQ